MSTLRTMLSLTCAGLTIGLAPAADAFAKAPLDDSSRRTIGALEWHTDYAAAYSEANRDHKLLLILFRDEAQPHVGDKFEKEVLAASELSKDLSRVVRAVLPVDVLAPAELDEMIAGKPLLEHDAFEHMQRKPGLAVLDLVDAESPLHGTVISAHPFAKGTHYTVTATKTILGLPRASITQRTLVYALRMHPERPASALGDPSPYLFGQAQRHSRMMSASGAVGHFDWGNRLNEMSVALKGRTNVSEVASMGFGGNLVDAAHSCVQTWRSSPTHWGMMSVRTSLFGYDMVRSANGNWFATGLIGVGR